MNGAIPCCQGKYKQIRSPDHPLCDARGYVLEHRLIAEKVLGHFMSMSVVVHHVNGNGLDNRNSNIVICQDNEYHMLIHQREQALSAFGIARARKCTICHRYDVLENLIVNRANHGAFHRSCRNEYQKPIIKAWRARNIDRVREEERQRMRRIRANQKEETDHGNTDTDQERTDED